MTYEKTLQDGVSRPKNGIMERRDKDNGPKSKYSFVGSKIHNRVLQNLIVGSYSDPPGQVCFL